MADENSGEKLDSKGRISPSISKSMHLKPPLARLNGRDFEYTITKNRTIIGRTSALGTVDVSMGNSSFISREHIELIYEDSQFRMSCRGKNGVFVGDVLCRKNAAPLTLPKKCIFRFPSTNIKIMFEAFDIPQKEETKTVKDDSPPVVVWTDHEPPQKQQKIEENIVEQNSEPRRLTGLPKKPLFVNIPVDSRSPCPSPTGTISAANSCPSSPRSSYSYNSLVHQKPNQSRNVSQREQFKQKIDCIKSETEHKPPYSYAQLIVQAISSSHEKQLSLSGIYSYITRHYPFYRTAEKGWQNSIRHNLSLNRYFVKVARSRQEPGKGSFWKIDSSSEAKLTEQAFRKRRQKSFRTPYGGGSTRSAPTSPRHLTGGSLPPFLGMPTIFANGEESLGAFAHQESDAFQQPSSPNVCVPVDTDDGASMQSDGEEDKTFIRPQLQNNQIGKHPSVIVQTSMANFHSSYLQEKPEDEASLSNRTDDDCRTENL